MMIGIGMNPPRARKSDASRYRRPSGIVPGGLRTIDGDVGIRVDAGVSALFKGFAVIKP
jgi:hypothetical protein